MGVRGKEKEEERGDVMWGSFFVSVVGRLLCL